MTTFADFLRDLEKLVQEHAQADLALKIEKDPENSIVQVFGEKAVPLELSLIHISEPTRPY